VVVFGVCKKKTCSKNRVGMNSSPYPLRAEGKAALKVLSFVKVLDDLIVDLNFWKIFVFFFRFFLESCL